MVGVCASAYQLQNLGHQAQLKVGLVVRAEHRCASHPCDASLSNLQGLNLYYRETFIGSVLDEPTRLCCRDRPTLCHQGLKQRFIVQRSRPDMPKPRPVSVFGLYLSGKFWTVSVQSPLGIQLPNRDKRSRNPGTEIRQRTQEGSGRYGLLRRPKHQHWCAKHRKNQKACIGQMLVVLSNGDKVVSYGVRLHELNIATSRI